MPDEDSIFVEQRNDVGHRADRRQADCLDEKVSHSRADFFGLVRPLTNGPGELESDARPTQAGERIGRARQPWMHDRRRGRQAVGEFVVVGHDQFQAETLGRFGLGYAGNAAIHGHDDRGAAICKRLQGLVIEAITLVNSVRDVIADFGSEQRQTFDQEGRPGNPIGVVIAIHDNRSFAANRPHQAFSRVGNSGEQIRIAQAIELGIEKLVNLPGVTDTPGDQQLRDDRRDIGFALQGRNPRRIVRTNPPPLGHERRIRSVIGMKAEG